MNLTSSPPRIWLFVIRFVGILLTALVGIFQVRFRWLFFYLMGSGKPHKIKVDWESVVRSYNPTVNRFSTFIPGEEIEEIVRIHHSTIYRGRGFWGRPIMFYVVGGMTLFLTIVKNGKNKYVQIYGEDIYDWHPADQFGNYFTSPLPNWLLVLPRFLLGTWGEVYFPSNGFPTNLPGISNRLWQDLELVGAKPFTTIVDGIVSSKEFGKLISIELSTARAYIEEGCSSWYYDWDEALFEMKQNRSNKYPKEGG